LAESIKEREERMFSDKNSQLSHHLPELTKGAENGNLAVDVILIERVGE
jgi:hypothetical protein